VPDADASVPEVDADAGTDAAVEPDAAAELDAAADAEPDAEDADTADADTADALVDPEASLEAGDEETSVAP